MVVTGDLNEDPFKRFPHPSVGTVTLVSVGALEGSVG